jgi:hypothetical protein
MMKTLRVEVNVGDSVELVCEVRGKPVPEVIWYHNAFSTTNLFRAESGGRDRLQF